jgi:hypothetical protein
LAPRGKKPALMEHRFRRPQNSANFIVNVPQKALNTARTKRINRYHGVVNTAVRSFMESALPLYEKLYGTFIFWGRTGIFDESDG